MTAPPQGEPRCFREFDKFQFPALPLETDKHVSLLYRLPAHGATGEGRKFFLAFFPGVWYSNQVLKNAGVLELVDEADSKSVGLITRAGSTPATGTKPI